jgi:hypothetical protein
MKRVKLLLSPGPTFSPWPQGTGLDCWLKWPGQPSRGAVSRVPGAATKHVAWQWRTWHGSGTVSSGCLTDKMYLEWRS